MISSLRFQSGYPTRLQGIGRRKIVFTDRINVLFGPNGSGKTTILETLAAAAGCGDGGWSDGHQPRCLPYKVSVEKDLQPVFSQDCHRNSDESFINTGYLEAHAHLRSTGEKRIGLVNELIDYIETRFPTLRHKREERPTLLLDEVDNHIGFAGQAILWGGYFLPVVKELPTHHFNPQHLSDTASKGQCLEAGQYHRARSAVRRNLPG